MNSAVLVLGLSLLAGGVPSDKKLGEVEYVYKQDLKRHVGLYRKGFVHLGHLDAQGNFLLDRKYSPFRFGSVPSGMPPYELINGKTGAQVYEYRSGRLIKGFLNSSGDFILDVGSRVIRFEDYHYSKDAPRIYNLPGKFIPKD